MKESIKEGIYIGCIIFITMVCSLFLIWVIQQIQWPAERKQVNTKPITIQQHEPDRKEPNQENMLYWLNYFEIQYPEIVLAQSIQECGWAYDSYRAQNMNNLFGFETNTGALTFGHWIGSVVYYKKWQDTYYQEGNYFDFLQSYGYAADTLYVKKLKQIILILEKE